jgi:hypothetical protein
MRLRSFAASAVAVFLAFASASLAWGKVKGDVYFGFSRVGANLYAESTDGMNGWQAAAHIKLVPFLGAEGDLAHYSQSQGPFSEQVTTVMFGPRVTVPAGALRFFAHGLGGLAYQNASITTYPYVDYSAVSYALGGGCDIPVFRGMKFRVAADYLGNGKAPAAADLDGITPSHLRIGAGLAYHF